MAKNKKRGLGRGFGEILGTSYSPSLSVAKAPVDTALASTTPAPSAPHFDDDIDDLSIEDSIEEPPAIVSVNAEDSKPLPAQGASNLFKETVPDIKKEEQKEPTPPEKVEAPKAPRRLNAEEFKGATRALLSDIHPNPNQPRTQFDEELIDELAASIKREGLLQPILVREMDDGTYQIIAGERRWKASQKAGLVRVPVIVKEVSDDKALELALIENVQRSDLNPIEEAYGYKRLMERCHMTQSDVAQSMSKGRSTIANALRLLDLPEDAQLLLFEGQITAGHARAILSITDPEGRKKLTEMLGKEKMTVREAEAFAKRYNDRKNKVAKPKKTMPSSYKAIARDLTSALKTEVKIRTSEKANKIEIKFENEEDLARIIQTMLPNE